MRENTPKLDKLIYVLPLLQSKSKMFTSDDKIKKPRGAKASELEDSVAQAIYDLQVNSEKLKAPLREVYITSAKEIALGEGKTCIIIFVPVPQLGVFQKLTKERSLIEELEKKFSGRSVLIVAERRILRKESRSGRQHSQARPISRTLTNVHESILDDLVFPTEVVGKRTRVKADGSKLLKVHLNNEGKSAVDKIDMYCKVYKSLTGKTIGIEFPSK